MSKAAVILAAALALLCAAAPASAQAIPSWLTSEQISQLTAVLGANPSCLTVLGGLATSDNQALVKACVDSRAGQATCAPTAECTKVSDLAAQTTVPAECKEPFAEALVILEVQCPAAPPTPSPSPSPAPAPPSAAGRVGAGLLAVAAAAAALA